MGRIIKFPRPLRRAIAAPPPPPQYPPATRAQSDGVGWLGMLLLGVLGAVLGMVLIPVMAVCALLWPLVKFCLGLYMLGILFAMLFGGTKWLLIGLAHCAVLGAVTFMLGARGGK